MNIVTFEKLPIAVAVRPEPDRSAGLLMQG